MDEIAREKWERRRAVAQEWSPRGELTPRPWEEVWGPEEYGKCLYYFLEEGTNTEMLSLVYSFEKYLLNIPGCVATFPSNYLVAGIRCPDGCIVENTCDELLGGKKSL